MPERLTHKASSGHRLLDDQSREATFATLQYLRRERGIKARDICDALAGLGEGHELDRTPQQLKYSGAPNFLPDENAVHRAITCGRATEGVTAALNLWLNLEHRSLYREMAEARKIDQDCLV